MFPRIRAWRAAVVLAGVAALVPAVPASAVIIGPTISGSTTGADDGDRLNVAEGEPSTLGPGTYDLPDFSFNSTGPGGVVPFLATSNGADSYSVVWVGAPASGAAGTTVSVNPVGNFKLAASATVYAGFYTAGGRVAYANAGLTDHDNSYTAPKGGTAITGFSNANLVRRYAFAVSAVLSQQINAGGGFLNASIADTGDRLNVDRTNTMTLTAGRYDLTDFSYVGLADAGTVTPFLARLTGTNTYETVWVGQAVTGVNGGSAVDPTGELVLAADTTLYAGFYTAGGARVALTDTFGLTDHDSAFTGPTAPGQVVDAFTNANLGRSYSFSIGVVPVPEPASAGLLLGGVPLLARRRRRQA